MVTHILNICMMSQRMHGRMWAVTSIVISAVMLFETDRSIFICKKGKKDVYLCARVFQEHHLQRAISAQQVFREKKENMVIPVPEAESNTTYYDRLYKGEVKVPKQLIHIQRESSFTLVSTRTWIWII